MNANGFSTTVTFEYGLTSSYGTSFTATPGTVTGSTATGILANITGLNPGTTYHFRVVAVNSGGQTIGNDQSFITLQEPGTSTQAATDITTTSATLNGIINANNSSTTITFEYGTTTSYGSSVAANPSPVTGNSDTPVTASLTSLTPGTIYHFRVRGLSDGGEVFGADKSFTTLKLPDATALSATNVTGTTSTLNGTVNANNSLTTVTFEYGLSTSYGATATSVPAQVSGNSATAVNANISGLTQSTLYHYRIKAESAAGIKYSSDLTFTTSASPAASTNSASVVGTTSATLNGNVNGSGLSTTVTFEYGLTTSYGTEVTASQSPVTGSTPTAVSANISGLNQATTYHFRVKAVSTGGTTYGSDQTFTTLTPPAATTGTATSVTSTTATLGGTVNANNLSTTVTFEYGLTTSYGTEVTSVESPVTGTSPASVSKELTGLTASVTYHYRVKAVSAGGTVYGSDQTFFTALTPPTASTGSAVSNTSSTATLEGTVNANGISATVTFEYGLTTSYGAEITAAQSPVTGTGSTSVSAAIAGLNAASTYHYRVKAVSAGGTTYGSDLTFTTLGTVTDYDGNIYNTVQIGTQVWLSENLKTTHYRDGTAIPNITTSEWGSLTYGSYRWLDHNIANKDIYGALYNSFTVVDNRNLCPAGWHVPTLAEFNTLYTYLGGETVAGGKMKEAGTAHWVTPNTGATNESGFTGLPGSYCTSSVHYQAGYDARFYTSTWYNQAGSTYMRGLMYDNSGISSGMVIYDGYSVRCIQGEGLVLPAVITTTVTNLGATTATSGGNVTSTGGSALTARGVCWSTAQHPIVTGSHTDDGTATGTFASSITSLTPGTTYYLRAYATNGVGTAYGNEVPFTTFNPPATTTGSATSITSSSATLGGTVNANGFSTVVTFEYGLTTSYGSEVTAAQSPLTGTVATTVSAGIIGLNASTTYHFRVKGVSSEGTSTGNDATFTTSTPPSVTDYDGNVYNIVTIGTQEWMQKNLMVTHYSNGDAIPNVTDNAGWEVLTSGALCWYNNNEATYKNTYGALYNWYTTADVRNVCPTGWHVPTDADWTTTTSFLGGLSVAGGKLKEAGTTNWLSPNTDGTNETGFTAVPGGYRDTPGNYHNLSSYGNYWSSSDGLILYFAYNSGSAGSGLYNVNNGFSARCVKGALPLAETSAAITVTSTSATLKGKVNANGVIANTSFEYGTSTAYGLSATGPDVWGTTPTSVGADITGLIPGTTYHYRVKAVNSGGTSYGSDMTFTTPAQVTDIDGNVYNTVVIGTQTWMQENLKTTKYSNGTPISGICAYADDTENVPVYGYLYYWDAVMNGALSSDLNPSGVQGVCPAGWHVPSWNEWSELSTFLGTESGGKMKEEGLIHWISPNTGATNESGFTALPSGFILYNPYTGYLNLGKTSAYWSSTGYDSITAYGASLSWSNADMGGGNSAKVNGYSVRCKKD